MSARNVVCATVVILLTLVTGCEKAAPTSTPATSRATPESPTATATPMPAHTSTPVTPTPTQAPLNDSGGGVIAFYSERDGNAEIYVMDVEGALQGTDSADPRRLTYNQADDYSPAWSPDGTQIAFESDRDDPNPRSCFPNCNYEIYVMNVQDALQGTGGDQNRLTNSPEAESHPAWSPDGTQLSFDAARDGDGNGEIYVMDIDSGEQRRLTNSDADDRWADWSPDGTQIAFCSNRDGNFEIYVMDIDGGNQRRLTYNEANDFFPDWSPDGTQIAFMSKRGSDVQTYVINVHDALQSTDGTDERQLTDLGRVNEDPDWSPDGTHIVFQSNRDGNFEIYVMNVADALQGSDGDDQRRLTDNRAGDFWPTWRPALPAADVSSSALEPPPSPIPTAAPTDEQRPDGLSQEQASTLASLEQVDDYPLYVMHYYGAYDRWGSYAKTVEGLASANPPSPDLAVLPPAWACSLFAALGDVDNMLYGRNFDWNYSPAVLLFTDPPDGYASVSMVDIAYLGCGGSKAGTLIDLPLVERRGLLNAPFLPFDGMNEHGLAIGMAAVLPGQMRRDPDKETIGSLMVIRKMLDHASDVDEAIAILESYNIEWQGGPPLHYLLADAAGGSALVEFYQGEMVVMTNEMPWHLATNFKLTWAGESPGGICWRYDRISQRLTETEGRMTVQEAIDLLAQVSQEGTQWSVVYGMSSGDVHVAMGREYDQVHTVRLSLAGE